MLGDYGKTVPMSAFTAGKTDDRGADIAHIAGARLVTATETERGGSLAESKIKELTGGEQITVRALYHNFKSFRPQAKIIMCGNHVPALRDIDESLKRRIRMISFERKPAQVDPDLMDALLAELPGILDWSLIGLQSYLDSPESSPTWRPWPIDVSRHGLQYMSGPQVAPAMRKARRRGSSLQSVDDRVSVYHIRPPPFAGQMPGNV